MAIDAVATGNENLYVSSSAEKASAKKADAGNEAKISQDAFLQLLVAQMTHQDPINPMDNSEFMSQLAQLQALDEQISTNKTLSAMHLESQLGAASALLGTLVQGVNDKNTLVKGVAARVSIDDGNAYVVLDNMEKVALPKITQMDVIMPPPDSGSNEPAEIINVDGSYVTFTQGQGAVPLLGNGEASVIDRDSTDYGGGFLTVKNVNGTDMDQLLIRGDGDIRVENNYVLYKDAVIGQINSEAQGANGDNLTINFTTSAADDQAVAALINSIYFNNTSNNPSTATREINLVLNDGLIESDPATVAVNMEAEVASNE